MNPTDQTMTALELRLFRMGALLLGTGTIIAFWGFGPVKGLSFAAGGLLAWLSLAWLRRTVTFIVFSDRRGSTSRVIIGYLLRLVLIPACLYVMIRFLFFSVVAAVAGFAVFNASILAEGVYEAFKSSSKENARAE
jgi:hypothetical protein